MICTEGGADRSLPASWAFFADGAVPKRHRTLRCPIHGKRHEILEVLEAFDRGLINVDPNNDGDDFSVRWKDLLMEAIEGGQPRGRRKGA